MLKGAKPWIGFVGAALAGGFVQVDPATGTEATALSPAEGLEWQVQQDIFAQQPGKVEPIVLKDVHIHLSSVQLDLLAAKALSRCTVQDDELIRYWNGNRLRAPAAKDDDRRHEGSSCKDAVRPAFEMERGLDRRE